VQPRKRAGSISWSEQQRRALAAIAAWQQQRSQPSFFLSGYAGTGKSTLAAEVDRRTKGKVLFAALSGKAARVLRDKGCVGASTIDSLIYRPQLEAWCGAKPPCTNPPCEQRCRYARERWIGRELNSRSDVADAATLIVDEVSTVGRQMGEDLLSFGTPVLVLGDTAQLPPIGDDVGYFTNSEPDFLLTEVHRQLGGSPVIELATAARECRPLRRGKYGDSAVIAEATIADMLNVDQVIVGTNRTRHLINKEIRRALGFDSPTPAVGEKVICLRNNRRLGLYNGTLWTVTEVAPLGDFFVEMTVEDDDGRTVKVVAPEEGFTSFYGNGADLPGQPFSFGYAITCHKSQGSQWGSVLVIDEGFCFREDRWRWLYTAVSRAMQRVVIVS
jgi:exodeoxyribonuclease-5